MVWRSFAIVAALVWAVGIGMGFAGDRVTAEQIHATHLAQGVECVDCHSAIKTDTGVIQKFPDESNCKACHDDPGALGYTFRKGQRRNVGIPHQIHLEMDKKCPECHQPDPKVNAVSLPTHKNCVECHQDDYDKMLCSKCHIAFGELGLNKLSSYKHANDFKTRHPEYARQNSRACAQCHTQSFCLDCHNKHEDLKPDVKYPEKVRANLIHRGDWISVHRIEAKVNDASCLKCHGVKFCTDCHNQRGVGAKDEQNYFRHPAGWMSKGSADFHGEKARTEILTCAACHDRGGAGDCRTCHKGSLGLNPHPKGWDGNGMSKKDRVCAECHSH